jgi:hypothetical protein
LLYSFNQPLAILCFPLIEIANRFLSKSGKKMPRRPMSWPTPTDWLAPFWGLQAPQSDRVAKASERLVARPAKARPVKKGQTSKKGALTVSFLRERERGTGACYTASINPWQFCVFLSSKLRTASLARVEKKCQGGRCRGRPPLIGLRLFGGCKLRSLTE